jgi:hypothetical protein
VKEIFQIVLVYCYSIFVGKQLATKRLKVSRELKKKRDMVSDTLYQNTTRRCLRTILYVCSLLK